MKLPSEPANAECYDLVRTRAPTLWDAFEQRLLPAARGDAAPADRVRELSRLEDEALAAVLEDDPAQTRDIGRAWPCVVEDLVGAVARAAIEDGAPRDQLEALLVVLTEERPPTFTGNAVRFEIAAAMG